MSHAIRHIVINHNLRLSQSFSPSSLVSIGRNLLVHRLPVKTFSNLSSRSGKAKGSPVDC